MQSLIKLSNLPYLELPKTNKNCSNVYYLFPMKFKFH